MAVERGGRGGQGSPCVGQSIEQTGLRTVTKVTLFRVVRGQEVFDKPTPHFVLLADDVLYFAGTVSDMTAVFAMQGLVPDTDQVEKIVGRLRSRCVVQVVISNSSSLTTRAVRDIRFRHKVGGRALICACGRALISAPHARHQVFWGIANAVHVAGVESRSVRGGGGRAARWLRHARSPTAQYNAAIVAVHRYGQRLQGPIADLVLQPGDTLLLEATRAFVKYHSEDQVRMSPQHGAGGDGATA